MPRPRMLRSSSMTTALVVVEPRSIPMKQRMMVSSSLLVNGAGGGALLLDHLEIALQPVLDVGRGKVARVHQVGLDERRRFPRALLDFAQDQQLPGGEAVAALDRIDQEAIGLVLVDVLADHVDALRQVEVGIAAKTVFGERLDRVIRIVAKAE